MQPATGDLLPVALGVAISPVPIVAVISNPMSLRLCLAGGVALREADLISSETVTSPRCSS